MAIGKRNYARILLTVILLLGGSLVALGLQEYWARQFDPVTFSFHYEFMTGFSFTDWTLYKTQTESLTPVNGRICITLTDEDITDPLVLSLTYTCDAPGAEVTAQGHYVWARDEGIGRVITSDPDFVILTDGTPKSIDPDKMPWGDISSPEGGQALELIFSLDKSGITESGDFSYTVSVSIGTE